MDERRVRGSARGTNVDTSTAAGPRLHGDSNAAAAGGGGPAGAVHGVKERRFWWAPWACVVALAAAVAVVVPGTTLVGGAVAALTGSAALLGWRLGEARRIALTQEIEGRNTELKRTLEELETAQAETVRRLSMAVEFRDEDTGAHIERIGRFSNLLAQQIGMDPAFCDRLTHAAPLHDVGKVAIPDAILLKPGPLTREERAIVETHAEEGHRLVRGSSSAILEMAATIALSHQEKWDGSGYPRGLAGERIPIEGRIVAIADVFDALTSDRVYRKAFSVEQAVQMMREQRGRHFDPVLLDAFMEVLGRYGPDGCAPPAPDPLALAESALEDYEAALERGDAELAESVIAKAIEDGVPPTTLHGEVIAPALRRIEELRSAGQIDRRRRQLARGITKRVLATLARYMLAGTQPSRERVLVVGLRGDEHSLELQMMHDQLAAAGFEVLLEVDVQPEALPARVGGDAPQAVLLGASAGEDAELEAALQELRSSYHELPILLGGIAAGGEIPREHRGMRVLERIDESVQAVQEELRGARAPAGSL